MDKPDNESSYVGRDADGNPSGLAPQRTFRPKKPTRLQLAERELDEARRGLSRVEYRLMPTAELARYRAALEAR